jgi:3-phenylpropionate/trans-cinnamate dioxygenase ferredoxin component
MFAAAKDSELPPGTLLGIVLPDGSHVCLLNHQGEIRALEDNCSHQDFPLSAGELLDDGTVECVWHGARFDCRTGAACAGPARRPVATYAVRVEDGTIHVGARHDPPPRPAE